MELQGNQLSLERTEAGVAILCRQHVERMLTRYEKMDSFLTGALIAVSIGREDALLILFVKQIAEHELTGHVVYRSWCRHIVAATCGAHAHASQAEAELLEIGIEYRFFGGDREDLLSIRHAAI